MTNEKMIVATGTGSVHGFAVWRCVTLEDLHNLSLHLSFLLLKMFLPHWANLHR